jgi:hypothetical protein
MEIKMSAKFYQILRATIIIVILALSQLKSENLYQYESAELLREYCLKTFGKSDLWYALIRHNGYKDTGEIKKGTNIKIPVQIIQSYLKKDADIQERLSNVIKSGAEIFSKEDMNTVRDKLYISDKNFKEGEFYKAQTLSEQIIILLNKIEKICNEAANHKVKAKVYDMEGEVDKQPAGNFSWISLHKNDNLKEQDKVRTMHSSYADIIFKDESHIFLDENSMMLIKNLRENQLKKTNSSAIVMVKGDLQALLNSTNSKDFKIDIPEIKTAINSNYFWLKRNRKKDVSISNYDGTIQVASAGKSVTVKKNEGVKVKYKKPPSNPIKLLNPPQKLMLNDAYDLSWEKVRNAVKYQIQVASNQFFQKDIVINKKLSKNFLTVSGLKDGVYYWRVRSIDYQGLPGEYSPARQFVFRSKINKPFLLVKKQVMEDSLQIEVDTQSGNLIIINDSLKTRAKTNFTFFKLPLLSGENKFKIRVSSPQGANSQESFSIRYFDKSSVIFSYPETSDTKVVEISGIFDRDYNVIFNKKEYRTKNRTFKKIVKLKEDQNLFPVTVKDEATGTVIYSDTLKILFK